MNMEKLMKNKKLIMAISFISAIAIIGCTVAYPATPILTNESGVVGLVVGALVGVVIAVALIPTIANQTATLEKDAPGDLSTAEEGLIGLWPLLIIVGVMIAIIGFAL